MWMWNRVANKILPGMLFDNINLRYSQSNEYVMLAKLLYLRGTI